MEIRHEWELAKIQETMPTQFMPVEFSGRLLPFLGHYHKVWLAAGLFPPAIRDNMRAELQASLKALTASLYSWLRG